MGENQPKAAGGALVFPGQRMHTVFPMSSSLSLYKAKLFLYKAAATVSHKVLHVTGHIAAVQLSPYPLSSRRLAPLSEESTRNCLIYVVLVAEPLQNNVLSAITLWGHGA